MRLPNAEEAQIDRNKLKRYLLSETHPVGRSKAKFFRGAGFDESKGVVLEQELIAIAKTEEVVETVSSRHGVKFVVDGTANTPSGKRIKLRTVWIIERGQDRPRFVTTYPV